MGKGLGRAICVGLYVFIVVACGGGGGGGGGGGAAPVVLTAISVDPATATLDTDQAVAVTCLGQYSDGSSQTVDANWANSAPAIAALSATQGTSVVVSGLSEGSATITASASGLAAQATITVVDMIPADPGTIYGCDFFSSTVSSYPALGSASGPTVIHSEPGLGLGFVCDRRATALYMIKEDTSGTYEIRRFDVATGAVSTVASLPAGYSFPIGLDYDTLGRLYTSSYSSGDVARIDPAAGSAMIVANNGGGWSDMAIGRDDAGYYQPLMTSPGSGWLSRQDFSAGGAPSLWATVPSAVVGVGGFGFILPAGVAINRRGEAFITDLATKSLYMHKDLNGDGDALDAGETVDYGATYTAPTDSHIVFGVSAAKGNSVLLFINPNGDTSDVGLYWLADRDGSGTAYGPGERVLYNATIIPGGFDGSPMSARR